MSDQGYRRPLLLALAGTVALTATYYVYTHYATGRDSPAPKQPTSLHRSNAVRRPRTRRRWRHGFDPVNLGFNPTEQALARLQEYNSGRRGYGDYHNTYLLPPPSEASDPNLALYPDNLQRIYELLIRQSPDFVAPQRDSLRLHIHGMFVQNFLHEAFPEGYIIGDETYNLASALAILGVAEETVYDVVKAFDEGEVLFTNSWHPFQYQAAPDPRDPHIQADGMGEEMDARDALQALAERSRDDDAESENSYANHGVDTEGSQNMLDLLYHIAGEQARREGYIHRGVECNSCGVHPIQGIRYHCANCFDFDLCESCEASSAHTKSHVFYKIRIPAPSRGNIKQIIQKWYPGNPNAFLNSLPKEVSRPLLEETGYDRTELDALYEQFKCLAGHFWSADPSNLGLAIDRKGFDAYFIPTTCGKPSPANLIYDRIFAFYDTNHDGLIGFQEFILGLARLQNKSRRARLQRIFEGYDLDADGYVDRKDFLRMFRAYYALSKELSREMINSQEDFGYVEEEIREVVQGSQPISAAFGGGNLYGHESRTGQDKQRQPGGELLPADGQSTVLQADSNMQGDRARAVGNVALGDRTRNHPFRSFREEPPEDEALLLLPMSSNFLQSGFQDHEDPTDEELSGSDPPLQTYGWPPPISPEPRDIVDALGTEISLEEITDPVDRSRILYAQGQRLDAEFDQKADSARNKAVEDRWERRQFYLDEQEGMSKPPGYTEPDSSDDEAKPSEVKETPRIEASPRRQSMQSRSSSKVRFDDSAIDTDYETRSNTSSRSIPANERWGGFELGQAEADIGKDILYQAVQQGFNELLDILFKDKEEDWLASHRTRNQRLKFLREREDYKRSLEQSEGQIQTAPDGLDTSKLTAALMDLNASIERQDGGPFENVASSHGSVKGTASKLEAAISEGSDAELVFDSIPTSPTSHGASSASSYHDPTLPQFRPNETLERPPSPFPKQTPNPFAADPEEARQTFELWARHDEIDDEAEQRGGYGKLSFREFRKKMIPEDETSKALGVKDKASDDEQEAWESSAELGRLAFVGTWLEMASF